MTHRTAPAHSSTKNNHPRNPDDEDTHAAHLHGDPRKKIHAPQVNRKPSQARLTFAGRVGSRVR